MRFFFLTLMSLMLTFAASAQTLPATPAREPVQKGHGGLPPVSAADRDRRAAVVIAGYRHDDILWENDRIAHRIYSRKLEAVEPPSGSGIDAWGKSVRWPFADRQLRNADQHNNGGEGLDFYHVGASRGMGGLGIWYQNKLWTSRNYARAKILSSGPTVADFRVEYDPWPVDVVRKVWETRRFTLPAGTNFTRMVSTIQSDKPGELIVGIGVAKRPTDGARSGQATIDKVHGRLAWWGPEDAKQGVMGIAVMVDPAQLVDIRQDADNYLLLVRVTPGKPFTYYAGAAWDRGLDFKDRAAWDSYVAAQTPSFDPKP